MKIYFAAAFVVSIFLSFSPLRSMSQTPEADNSFGFDDLMTMLIQPRHIKLYYAGANKNWELAAAQSRDMRTALTRIEHRVPRYMNNDVADTIKLIFISKLDAVDAAIAAGDPKQFVSDYLELTQACNACHVYMEHPYIVVQVPRAADASAYPDQTFRSSKTSH